MRAHALALVLTLPLFSLTACEAERDYSVAVSWLINGSAPTPQKCAEQGVARARFEVRSRGDKVQTLEADCASLIERWHDDLGDYVEYGGFLTKRSFEWGVEYSYALTLVDAQGAPVSGTGEGQFGLAYDEGDIYELPYLDYFHAPGLAAGVHAEWSAGPGDIAADCATRRIDRVQIVVSSALDLNFDEVFVLGEVPCAAGSFTSAGKVLATGYYHFRYETVSPDGAFIAASAATAPIEVFDSDVILPRLPL